MNVIKLVSDTSHVTYTYILLQSYYDFYVIDTSHDQFNHSIKIMFLNLKFTTQQQQGALPKLAYLVCHLRMIYRNGQFKTVRKRLFCIKPRYTVIYWRMYFEKSYLTCLDEDVIFGTPFVFWQVEVNAGYLKVSSTSNTRSNTLIFSLNMFKTKFLLFANFFVTISCLMKSKSTDHLNA